jgi:ubiquitin-protein ligase
MIRNLQRQGKHIFYYLRWRPILTPEDVLISIVSMLSEPNINSPANVDAGI